MDSSGKERLLEKQYYADGRQTGRTWQTWISNGDTRYIRERFSKYRANIRMPPEACSQSKFSLGA